MQVNQNVNAANFLLVSSQAGSPMTTKEELSAGMDFANVLKNTNDNYSNQSNNSFLNEQNVSPVSKAEDSGATSDNAIKDDDVKVGNNSVVNDKDTDSKKTEMDKDAATKETSSKDAQDVNETSETTKVNEADDVEEKVTVLEGMEELSEEDMAILLETVSNLLQDVMEQFDLTVEELTSKLEEFDMDVTDLFTKDGLKEFFLKMNDSIVSDLIVNEDLNMQLQDFMSEVSEELQVLDTLTVDADVMLSEETVKSVIEQVMPNKDADIITNQSVSEVTQESVHDEPEVIITNETTQTNTDTEQSTDNADSQPEKQEQEVVSKQTTKQEVETNVTEHATTKQNTFENPILQAIQNAVNTVETVVNAEQPVQQVDIVRQVVEQVRVNMNQQATSLELQLYPEHLGKIQINVVSKDGVLTASIVAETEAAKQAIEGGLLNLKEAMQQQDLKVEAIEVMVSTMGFEKGEEQQQSFDEKGSSNPRRKIDLSELGEAIPVEDEVEIEKMKATGSSVSYRA